ncbi:MAG: HAD hydrolase-like protein [Anaerolineae bacterium]|jgi:phosphoglycolate phosphatase-like HAD superfamily hydrolase|nr:HAD hydrolase-like protein [Anaerolineae bacterium]
MKTPEEIAQPLIELKPETEFFIGIDSDGCAFDSMEIKHKECFIPNIIKYWSLQAVSKYAREAAEFVNLYSKWRGVNRWPALVNAVDLLGDWDEVQRREVKLPDFPNVRAFVQQEQFPHSNEGLKLYMDANPGKPDLEIAWAWTHAVNDAVADIVHGVPPFPFLRESLQKLMGKADMIVVSATPVAALTREWNEHHIDQFVRVIAGQEMGKKAQHLQMAAKGKYRDDHILMIGDAPGDMRAAKANNALFYPINPGAEEASWQRFYEEAADKFLNEEYAGDYEAKLIAEFESYLPDTPPWKA